MLNDMNDLPVAVIGGGPIGLAAAAHLVERGIPVRVYEAGENVGATIAEWAHVRTFSPWSCNVDSAAGRLLARHGWLEPEAEHIPTGGEILRDYLLPLAKIPEMAAVIETGAKVARVSRHGIDKVTSKDRDTRPFVLSVTGRDGVRRELARAVVDASGTWMNQNPLGSEGFPADGEAEHQRHLTYGMPDVLGRDRSTYAGKVTLVIGAGYSAANVLLDLAKLAEDAPGTSVVWVVRGTNLIRVYGGALADGLPARGELGAHVKSLVDSGHVRLITGFRTTAVRSDGKGCVILDGDTAAGVQQIGPADRVVVATGQRPDLDITRELRLELDPWLESAKALGPLIDPNVHSCGSVPPHGYRELSHPEPGFYTIGVKSYGRAPTFLLLTGYEQARSVAAAIAGDFTAADAVQLVLPETGVCSTRLAEFEVSGSGECCGGPVLERADACCRQDADAKDAGEEGCGCSPAPVKQPAKASCCGAAA